MARVLGLAALVLTVLPQGAQAWWHRQTIRTAAYYYPVPVYSTFVAYPTVVPYAVPVQLAAPAMCPPTAVPSVPATPAPPVASTLAVPAVPNYAQPSTAPPSSGLAPYPATPEPSGAGSRPSGAKRTQGLKPIATTERYFDSYVVAPPDDAPVAHRDRQPVSFWNLSGHDAVVRIDGQPQTVPAGKRLDLVLGHQFVWQVDGREPQAGKLPDNGAGLDIVIRR